MGVALLWAAALQAAAIDPSQKVYDAEFAPLVPSERQYAASGPAGPYFPERAFRAHQSGEALMRCTAAPDAGLQQCVHVTETPGDAGFADAARILAIRKRIKAPDGAPVGKPIVVRVPFMPGAPVNGIDHVVHASTLKAVAADVRGHAEVACLMTDKGLDRCFVLYFRSMAGRPANAGAGLTAVTNDAAAALAATAQVSLDGLPKDGWVIIPMDFSPKP